MQGNTARAHAMPGSAQVVVPRFLKHIGRGDLVECAILMHPDIRYRDAHGTQLVGWDDCLELVRRMIYRISQVSVDVLAMATTATRAKLSLRIGAADDRFNGPACWTVRVEDGLVRDVAVRRPDGLATAEIMVPDLL